MRVLRNFVGDRLRNLEDIIGGTAVRDINPPGLKTKDPADLFLKGWPGGFSGPFRNHRDDAVAQLWLIKKLHNASGVSSAVTRLPFHPYSVFLACFPRLVSRICCAFGACENPFPVCMIVVLPPSIL